jgi:hypothetical protein
LALFFQSLPRKLKNLDDRLPSLFSMVVAVPRVTTTNHPMYTVIEELNRQVFANRLDDKTGLRTLTSTTDSAIFRQQQCRPDRQADDDSRLQF